MNRLIVVTGGTMGIGRAILVRFAAAGFDVATCARRQPELNTLKTELEKTYGITAHVHAADMANKSQVQRFGAFVQAIGSPVEVLVNNAGYFKPGNVLDEQDGALENMINANLFSAYHITRALVPAMSSARHGHVFNVCSIASFMAYPNGGSYSISKFALMGFSKVLREELKEHNVRVTAVLPGATLTASWAGVDLPDERFMKAEDVADTVFSAYMLSGRSVVEEIIIRPQRGDI